MRYIEITEQQDKNLGIIMDAALKAGGMQILNAVNALAGSVREGELKLPEAPKPEKKK